MNLSPCSIASWQHCTCIEGLFIGPAVDEEAWAIASARGSCKSQVLHLQAEPALNASQTLGSGFVCTFQEAAACDNLHFASPSLHSIGVRPLPFPLPKVICISDTWCFQDEPESDEEDDNSWAFNHRDGDMEDDLPDMGYGPNFWSAPPMVHGSRALGGGHPIPLGSAQVSHAVWVMRRERSSWQAPVTVLGSHAEALLP